MESSERPPESLRVAVFAKAPVAGAVKTRLAPVLGLAGAARLHSWLVRRALEAAREAAAGDVELWCAPDESHPFFAECAAAHGVRLRSQEGGDLGARMSHAFATAHGEGAAMVLVGSDCPALGAAQIDEAARALGDHDAAIAPAEDGGYGLIALTRPCPRLFSDIAWGTATVMAETRRRLAAAAVAWRELPRTWDVDRPEDYERLRREGWLPAELA